MAIKVGFYCWVRCNTCRKAKEFLSQKNVEIDERDFFKVPFSRKRTHRFNAQRTAPGSQTCGKT